MKAKRQMESSLNSVTMLDGTGGHVMTTYASGAQYVAHGGISSITLGTSATLVEQHCYNSRLQVTGIRVGSSTATNCTNTNNTDLINLAFTFTAGQNNGNVQSQTIQYQSSSEAYQSLTQSYTSYDALNRLTGFSENSKIQTYGYDRYGNRWRSATDVVYPNDINTPTQQSHYDAATNRITLGSVGYDLAGRGNVVQLNPFTLTYDGENHQKTMVSANSNAATYDYDGDGRRVRRMTCSGTSPCTTGSSNLATTIYVYDAFGQLTAEYPTTLTPTSTEFLVADHLGSTRLILDHAGNVKLRYDYLPFGEGLGPGVNGRSTKYSVGAIPTLSDGESLKFASKERDAETGLDHFLSRYMAGLQGRFTSVDPENAGASDADPQSWNGYSYGANNPLAYVDPDGLRVVICTGYSGCTTVSDQEYLANSLDPSVHLPVLAFGQQAVDFGQIFCEGFAMACGVAYYYNDNPIATVHQGIQVDASTLANIVPALKAVVGTAAAGLTLGAVIGGAGEREEAAILARLAGVLRGAAKFKGNFGLGEASAQEAEELGRAWVGSGATVARDGKTLISADGLRQYRPPSFKPNLGRVQANFESRPQGFTQWQSNGHLDIR